MSLISFFRDKVKGVLTPQSEAVLEVSVIDPNNPNNRLIPGANGGTNANLQVGDIDVPGGAGAASPSTPRIILASDDPAVTKLTNILGQLDITLSALRDSIRGASTKDFTTLETDVEAVLAKLPATLGQKASAASMATVLSTEQENILTALKTALEIIDNVVSGSEAQVDVVTLPQASSVPYGTIVIAATATAQQLPSNVAKQGVIVVANENNDAANIVYLGFSNSVTNTTYLKQLLPGEATFLLPVSNSDIIWVYCVFTGGTHSYNYAVF